MRRCFPRLAAGGLFAVVLALASVTRAADGPPPVSYLGFHSTEEAEAAVESLRSRIESLERTIEQQDKLASELSHENFRLRVRGPNYSKIDDQIAKVKAQLRALEREKALALQEIRDGLFCDGCWQTKSQILKTGSVFPHPGQNVVNLTAQQLTEKLAQKAAEFDNQGNPLRQQIAALERQKEQVRREWQAAVDRTERLTEQARRDRDLAQDEYYRLRRDLIDAEAAAHMLPLLERWSRDAWETTQRRLRDTARRDQERQLATERRRAEDAAREETYWRQREKWLADLEAGARQRNDSTAADAARQERESARGKYEAAQQSRAAAESRYTAAREAAGERDGDPSAQRPAYRERAGDWSERLSRLYDDTASGVRQLRDAGLGRAREFAQEQQEDFLGRDPLDWLKRQQDDFLARNLDYGPKPLSSQVSDLYGEMADDIFGLGDGNPLAPKGIIHMQVIEPLKDLWKDTLNTVTRNFVVDRSNEAMFGTDRPLFDSTGDGELDRAQRDFERAVSPGSLLYEAAPFTGGRSILGFKKYAEEVQNKFFDWFGLATKKLDPDDPGN